MSGDRSNGIVLPLLEGVALDQAYECYLHAAFSESPEETAVLTPDACEALANIDRRSGCIERHPDLAFADDDYDSVAIRLINGKQISETDALDDIKIHRLFLNAFRDGAWLATGRRHDRGGEERLIDWPTIRSMTVIRLRRSEVQESRTGGLKFVDVRVWSPQELPAKFLGAVAAPVVEGATPLASNRGRPPEKSYKPAFDRCMLRYNIDGLPQSKNACVADMDTELRNLGEEAGDTSIRDWLKKHAGAFYDALSLKRPSSAKTENKTTV